ncbi:MAG: SurA N-terminal domain-containing protein [Deltaproteobacteria bacterium]|nr:SurA N-terminal domain-containing protein [Deltaproteobacteria bacterium]
MLTRLGALAFVVLAQTTGSSPVLDRIVAMVGEQPVFLSELRERERVQASSSGGAAVAGSQRRELLQRLIDERIEEREAEKQRIAVTEEEIDNGIGEITKQLKLTKEQLLAEVKRHGMTERAYRAEIRRQILEGKLIQLAVRSRVRVTDADARKAYDAYVKELSGANAPVDLRILVLRVGDADDAKKKASLADQIVQKARSGTDFCSLVSQHSDDPATKSSCGSRGPLPPGLLLPEIAKVAAGLDPGKTAAPFLLDDPSAGKAYLVIQKGAPVKIPTFEALKDQMKERAMVDAMERERTRWLDGLRKGVFVDVRL